MSAGPSCSREGKLCAQAEGFSLEAGRHVHEHDREALHRLCSYGLRPPVALGRLHAADDGKIRLAFKRPFSDGTTHVDFSPVEFLRRLALCVPPPRFHLMTYFGLFAPHARRRPLLSAAPDEPPAVPAPQVPAETVPDEIERHGAWLAEPLPFVPAPFPRQRALDWETLHRRTHQVDVTSCDRCGNPMRVVEIVTDPREACAILDRLDAQARSPPAV